MTEILYGAFGALYIIVVYVVFQDRPPRSGFIVPFIVALLWPMFGVLYLFGKVVDWVKDQ